MDKLVELKDEQEAGAEANKLGSGPSGDAKIVAHVKHVIAVKRGEIIEVDVSEDEDGEADLCADLTFLDAMQMCEKLEAACWKFSCPDNDLTIPN